MNLPFRRCVLVVGLCAGLLQAPVQAAETAGLLANLNAQRLGAYQLQTLFHLLSIEEGASAVADGVAEAAETVVDGVEDAAQAVSDGLSDAADAVVDGVSDAAQAVADGAEALVDQGAELLQDGWDALGDLGESVTGYLTAGVVAGKALLDELT